MAFFLILIAALLAILLLEPLATYLIDKKNFRRFPNQNAISGISNLGYFLERLGGFRSRRLHRVHEKHSIVRVGPNSLSFSSPQAIREIYGHSTTCIKGDMYWLSAGSHFNVLNVVEKTEHARKRRYMANVFATRNLDTWEHKVADKIQRLVRQFDAVCAKSAAGNDGLNAVVDFRKWSNLFTIEAILDIAISRQLGCLENGNDTVVIYNPEGHQKSIRYIDSLHSDKRATSAIIWANTWFPVWRRVLEYVPGFSRSNWRRGQDFDDLVSFLTEERIQRYNNGEDLDDLVRSILQDKEGMTRELDLGEVTAELNAFSECGS
jgi:benzoate 4-monooxygenase